MNHTPFARFLRWFESDSPELELQRSLLFSFHETAQAERLEVVVDGDEDEGELSSDATGRA